MFSYFAAPLMNKLTGLFSASQRRFLRFVLNINLRPYLRNPIQQGELDLQIDTGRVELKDVELNEKTLNRKLGENSVVTVKSGLVGSIAISVPWNNIRNENIKVTLSNIELIVVPGKNETFFEEAVAPVSLQSDDDEEEDNMPDNTPDPTLNAMEKMFEGIFSNIEVTIHNLSIFLETSGSRTLHSTLSSLNIGQASASSLNSNYLVDFHLAYAKIAKDTTQEGAHTVKFRDISVKLDEKPADSSHIRDTTSDIAISVDDVGITPRTTTSMSNNVILSYLSSDPTLFDYITYKAGAAPTTPTGSPTRPNPLGTSVETAQKLEVAAKLTNSSLKCNLSLENYHRLMYIISQFVDPPPPSASSSPTTSTLNPPPTNISPIRTSNGTSTLAPSSSIMTSSSLGMSSMGINMGASTLGMSSLGMSNLGSSMLQFSAFFPPNSSGSRLDSNFFSNGNLMDSAIFGTMEESRLEKSILTKYSAFSSWTPSLSQKILLRLEVRSGSCSLVIPVEHGKTMTTNVAFDGLVFKMKKLRVVQSFELRFNKFCVSADDETSNKPVVEITGSSLRTSQSEPCFKANVSIMHSEDTNDSTLNVEIQTRPIYLMYDGAWLDSIKRLVPLDPGPRAAAKKGKFSLHAKFHATSTHIVLPFPKKEGVPYFPSRFGKRNWLVDLYMDNLKVTYAAIGNVGNGKTHVLVDSIVSYFGMKYENDAVKWLDIHRTAATPVIKFTIRTKNPAPNPAHPGFNMQHSSGSAHAGQSAHSWNSQHARSAASSAHATEASRFSSPSLVFSGKKIDTKNLDIGMMQKASAVVVEVALPPATVEISKDDYDILREFINLFSSDEESPMTHIDISCPNVRITLHDRKKQRLKKKKSEISSKIPTEVYYNTYRLNAENFDVLCSISHFTTKSSLFMVRVDELEASVSDNNCTNLGEKVVPLLQKVTKRRPKHESPLTLVVPSLRVTGEDYQVTLSDKLCGAPNISMLFGFVDWFTAPPPPSALSASSILSTSSSSSSSSSSSLSASSYTLSSSSKLSPSKSPSSSTLSSSSKLSPSKPPPTSQLSSALRTSSTSTATSLNKSSTSSLRTSGGAMTSSLPPPTHTQIVVPNVLLVHTPTNAGTSQIVVAVEILTVSIVTSSPGNTKITVKLTGPRVLLSLLRNYPNLEPINLSKYLMENNFKEILTMTPNRSETLSSLEISIKLNDHATKSVVSIDFDNRKMELTTVADTFHALKLTFPLFLQSVSEHFLGDEGDLGNVPIVTHADGSSGSTITLPQMAARYGEGLSDSLLNRSWWGDSPEARPPQSNLKKTREILSQGYFVVEHPANEEERKTFQSNLDVLRNTELVLEIEEEVEADESQLQQEQAADYEMDDSILDSWIVMGTDHAESIMNPESIIVICGLNFSWKIDIQKERHTSTSSTSTPSHVVSLLFDVPLIRYEVFPESWAHRKSMMLRVEFNDIRVEDHLLSSAYRNVFTFDIPSATSKKGNVKNANPQTISVASITFSARRAYGDIPHYSAKIALAPVYLGVNQKTLDLLLDFFNRPGDTENAETTEPSASPTPIYFDKFQVSPLKLVVDYKPRGLEAMDYSKVVAGGYLWLVAMIPLECASFTLSEIDITKTTLDKLPEGIASTWMPNFLQTNIPQYIKGVQPIKIVAKMGSGVIGLVKVPIQEYKKDANILHGVGKGIQTLTFEVLNFGSRVTVSANKILKKTERMISGSPSRLPNEQKISSYANQPGDIREGAVQGMQVLLAALSGAADGIITRPLEEYQKNGNWGFVSTFLRGLPGCVLQPVIGVTGAVSKLTLGLRNTLDNKEKLKADAKYKTNDFAFEFQESNNNTYAINTNNSNVEFTKSRLASYEVMEDYDESRQARNINNNSNNSNNNNNFNNDNITYSNNNSNSFGPSFGKS